MNNPDPTGTGSPEPQPAPETAAAETVSHVGAASIPRDIGRYRIEKILGHGGFGLVYLGHDQQLRRAVAIKVPHRRRIAQSVDVQLYLSEARTVASLDHPNIVPVFDVGSTDEFPCFVVSKYIEGSALSQRIKNSRPTIREAVELVIAVAEALHYAHRNGIVHRDIKPSNILVDGTGRAFVADFGVALREEDFGRGATGAGTPAYMSPEQARGEGHRVDGRSDIFSLGIVLYELLTGRRPFQADSVDEILERVRNLEVRPLRQVDDRIPRELERICLKALAKRATERYTTASDLADDLRYFLLQAPEQAKLTLTGKPALSAAPGATWPSSLASISPTPVAKIVPKGLRSFDAGDADFFLELLPGPRDRDGLPDSIRFWKNRIEQLDADKTFAIGLIYGPSGCGKSSLVKAGLLPRLANHVDAVYVEATGDETESLLLKALRRQCPNLPTELGLIEAMAAIRRGLYLPTGHKILLVIDQFEQWLHAQHATEGTAVVQALRQCDGVALQCIVMVRDDFWLAISRFMTDLEVNLVQGQNTALVDLFDGLHARRVLAAFGRAFGRLPEDGTAPTAEQNAFLDQAIAGMAQDGKVVSVRLSLFAEMVKGKHWSPATLEEVGGAEGVGVTFLEETFAASTAPPPHRVHQKAAQAVLRALLPEDASDIKGNMKPRQHLLEISGYAKRPKDFEALVQILDTELRLITPTDPNASGDDNAPTGQAGAEQYYQLTHDYLVPSLWEWLTRKQKQTRGGRAALRLQERSRAWNTKPEKRNLPTWLEWLSIRCWIRKRAWTPAQQRMMGAAGRHYRWRSAMHIGIVAIAVWAVLEAISYVWASILLQALPATPDNMLPALAQDLMLHRRWARPQLKRMIEADEKEFLPRLRACRVLLELDPAEMDYVLPIVLKVDQWHYTDMVETLTRYSADIVHRLWSAVDRPEIPGRHRINAAALLLFADPKNSRWGELEVAELLVESPAADLRQRNPGFPFDRRSTLPAVFPVEMGNLPIVPRLDGIARDKKRRVETRERAFHMLARFTEPAPDLVAEALLVGFCDHHLLKEMTRHQPLAYADSLTSLLLKELTPTPNVGTERGIRISRAASGLLALRNERPVWELFRQQPDPWLRTLLIDSIGHEPELFLNRLDIETDVSIRRALILVLKRSYRDADLDRPAIVARLRQAYLDDPDPGVHSAADWALRPWFTTSKDDSPETFDRQLVSRGPVQNRRWYVDAHGHTWSLIPGPVEFKMGSPNQEENRRPDENLHNKRITRSFLVATREVTVEQFQLFLRDNPNVAQRHSEIEKLDPRQPMHSVTWFEAIQYCRWLSEQDNVPDAQMCYPAVGDFETAGKGSLKLPANYLTRSGYRLPTETEWEYACRAGTVSDWCSGSAGGLGGYAQHGELLFDDAAGRKKGPKSVGELKPNDFGLFDMHGNAAEWCHDRYLHYPVDAGDKVIDDREDSELSIGTQSRVLRGGSVDSEYSEVRSAFRASAPPDSRPKYAGFRIARTLPSNSPGQSQ